jgi:glutamate synthase domain-containing protein 2
MDYFIAFYEYTPWWAFLLLFIMIVATKDVFFNKAQTIKHNFPVVGHFRYMLEKIGPELRQYIVSNNREEMPFNRSQRTWIYASSKKQNNYSGFGTDQDVYAAGHIFINPDMFPYHLKKDHLNNAEPSFVPCAKVMGLYNKRRRPFRPYSIVNISAMSYGSLSAKAIESLNKGALKAGCYHNTGEGGLSPYHSYGSDVIFHFGTGYFGVRDDEGNFSFDKLDELVKSKPFVRAIEIKLSQGAKPGKGGVLPAAKITQEIADIRHIPLGKDVLSPPRHSAFSNIPEMLEFIEKVADKSGLPVGIKSAVGKLGMWEELANLMVATGKGPDFITIDGGEGGTGAAPPAFADHVSLPFVYAFSSIYKLFQSKGLTDRVVFIASGKLGFPGKSMMALAMGADIINVAREAMMSIGCIQAQVCHTNRCPAGIATSNKWLQGGVDPALKSERFYNYVKNLRKEILEITHACGYEHPSQLTMKDVDVSMGDNNLTQSLKDTYSYDKSIVPFVSMKALKECPHLGGLATKSEKVLV